MENCLFCKVIAGEIPSNKVYEDERCLAFYDIDPQAPTHFLVIPKEHIGSVAEIGAENSAVVAHIFEDIAKLTKELGLESCQVVVSAFGSQGARVMNETVAEVFALEQKDGFPFRHIHAVGSFGWGWMPEKVRSCGVDYENCPHIDLREYIYNMPAVMAALRPLFCASDT